MQLPACAKPLSACEGALLVVDASQGVEAQTVANCYTATELGVELNTAVRGSFLHIILPPIFQKSETIGEVKLYCIADEKGDMTKQIKSMNGEFALEMLTTMKGNYTLKLTIQNKGVDYYFEKKIML